MIRFGAAKKQKLVGRASLAVVLVALPTILVSVLAVDYVVDQAERAHLAKLRGTAQLLGYALDLRLERWANDASERDSAEVLSANPGQPGKRPRPQLQLSPKGFYLVQHGTDQSASTAEWVSWGDFLNDFGLSDDWIEIADGQGVILFPTEAVGQVIANDGPMAAGTEGRADALGFAQLIFLTPRWGTDLIVRALRPRAEVEAEIGPLQSRLTNLGLLAVGLSGLLALGLVRRLLKPVQSMMQMTARLSQREWSARAEVLSGDELGTLAGSLNDMAARLEEQERRSVLLRDFASEVVSAGSMEEVAAILAARTGAMARDAVIMVHLGAGPRWDEGTIIARAPETLLMRAPKAELNQWFDRCIDHLETEQAIELRVEDALWREFPREEDQAPLVLAQRCGIDGNQPIGCIVVLAESLEVEVRQDIQCAVDLAEASIVRRRMGQRWLLAKEEAERANRAKSQFLANMSHELRTPLNAIIGLSESALHEPMDESARELVHSSHSAALTLLSLMNDILDWSKIEAGRLELDPKPFALRHELQEALRPFQLAMRNKPVQLLAKVEDAVPDSLLADWGRIRQIIVNLVGNASKFTTEGEILVSFALLDAEPRPAQRETTTLVMEVRDTGIGIAPEAQLRIFEAFAQADMSTTRRYGGTGLGLSICAQLARAFGGRISLQSEPGRGSVFRVLLHVRVAAPAAPSERSPSSEPAGAAESAGATLPLGAFRILVAEDNPVNQRVIRLVLKRLGQEATVVSDGSQAVAAVQESEFDLVLMDLQMPVMGGLDAARAIRAAEQQSERRVPIVALTANAFEEDRTACLDAGMDDFLTKPLDSGRLAATIARLLPSPAPRS